jgi:hypothetical protein
MDEMGLPVLYTITQSNTLILLFVTPLIRTEFQIVSTTTDARARCHLEPDGCSAHNGNPPSIGLQQAAKHNNHLQEIKDATPYLMEQVSKQHFPSFPQHSSSRLVRNRGCLMQTEEE